MKSIKTKMLFSTLAVILVIFSVTIGFISYSSFKLQEKSSFAYAKAETEKYVEGVQDDLIRGLAIAKTLSKTFEGMKENGVEDRNELISILRNTIESNPNFVGVWTVWEPNALDGKDAEYTNAEHHDETGRFKPYWNRGSGV